MFLINGHPPTLAEARAWLRERLDDGAHCPCCGQYAKVYRRTIASTVAKTLIRMWNLDRDQWCNLPAYGLRGGDIIKTRFWGLIEPMPGAVRDDGSHRVGYWRLTPAGVDFIRHRTAIPKWARIYNNHCLGLDNSRTVTITDSLGTRFNYRDLMDGN